MGGRGSKGGGSGGTPHNLYTEKNGVRTYLTEKEGAAKAFMGLSASHVHWNKGAFISKDSSDRGSQVKRTEMFNYLKNKDINSFILRVPKGDEKRALKQFSDYGYHVVAQRSDNSKATAKHQEVQYYMSRKEMQYLGLDFKVKKYYKRGWKG